jgi:hypothetical protein
MIGFRSTRFLLSAILFTSCFVVSAQKFATSSGEIKFTSKAELELIKAISNKVQGRFDIRTRQFAFLVNIASFEGFNSALQRSHFNEKYMESDKFATAKFSGKIIEDVSLEQPGVYEVRAKGELEIHGQKQIRIIKSKVTVRPNEILIEATFTVPLADHNIAIPKIVSQKIATEIAVEFASLLTPQS